MEDDVAKALAYQVKRDLAERYFGLRRLIEEDSKRYFQQIEKTKSAFEERLAVELIRLYLMLRDEDLIEKFLNLCGLREAYYYDPYFLSSENIRRRLFKGLAPHGWTSKGKFKHLFFQIYSRLAEVIDEYQQALQELQIEAEVINEEIKRFKEKFDLSEIMHFLKSLDTPSDLAALGHPSLDQSVSNLEKTLEFQTLPPPEKFLPPISRIPPLKEIEGDLGRLVKEAYRRHKEEALKILEDSQSREKD